MKVKTLLLWGAITMKLTSCNQSQTELTGSFGTSVPPFVLFHSYLSISSRDEIFKKGNV
jgi:hypothetical protein